MESGTKFLSEGLLFEFGIGRWWVSPWRNDEGGILIAQPFHDLVKNALYMES